LTETELSSLERKSKKERTKTKGPSVGEKALNPTQYLKQQQEIVLDGSFVGEKRGRRRKGNIKTLLPVGARGSKKSTKCRGL